MSLYYFIIFISAIRSLKRLITDPLKSKLLHPFQKIKWNNETVIFCEVEMANIVSKTYGSILFVCLCKCCTATTSLYHNATLPFTSLIS